MSKRIHTPTSIGQMKINNFLVQEEDEEIKEAQEEKGHMNLCQYRKKLKHISKKRCWICKSFNHLKKSCPQIRCFYCKKLMHVKANCFRGS